MTLIFWFNDTTTTEIYTYSHTLSLHYALPIFQDTFNPMLSAISDGMSPFQAYMIRALTLHEWRRIVLHDPQLPKQMLPQDWPGHGARTPCAKIGRASLRERVCQYM